VVSSPYAKSWTALQVGQIHSVPFQTLPSIGIETAFVRMTANRTVISSSGGDIFLLVLPQTHGLRIEGLF
jgi:hypothetical protein